MGRSALERISAGTNIISTKDMLAVPLNIEFQSDALRWGDFGRWWHVQAL
jgi:hypothetical protein